MSILPYCMMPDGGDPCKGYAALKAERDRLTIIADAIQTERDRLATALEEVASVSDGYGGDGTTGEGHARCREIARRALDEASRECEPDPDQRYDEKRNGDWAQWRGQRSTE